MVRPAVSGRNARQKTPAGLGADAADAAADAAAAAVAAGAAEPRLGQRRRRRQQRPQAEHGPARRCVLRRQTPGDAAHRDQHDAHTWSSVTIKESLVSSKLGSLRCSVETGDSKIKLVSSFV